MKGGRGLFRAAGECFLASGSIEMENHTNAQLVLTLITCPGTFSFHFLHFFFAKTKCIFALLFCFKYTQTEDRAALIQQGQVDIQHDRELRANTKRDLFSKPCGWFLLFWSKVALVSLWMGSGWSAKVSVFAGRRTTITGTSWTSKAGWRPTRSYTSCSRRLKGLKLVPVVQVDPLPAAVCS